MFRLVDSRTLLLLVATQCVLLSLVRCQQEDDRKLEFFILKFKVFCQNFLLCCHGDMRGKFGMDQFARFTSGLWDAFALFKIDLKYTQYDCILSLSVHIFKV